jgi:Cupredoxin-like domain
MMKTGLHFFIIFLLCSATPAFCKDVSVSLNLIEGSITKSQQVIKVKQNDQIEIKVTSDTPGEFHLHAYRIEVKLNANQSETIKFQAYATGRFNFEWHPAANMQQPPAHHHQALATLEVFPN